MDKARTISTIIIQMAKITLDSQYVYWKMIQHLFFSFQKMNCTIRKLKSNFNKKYCTKTINNNVRLTDIFYATGAFITSFGVSFYYTSDQVMKKGYDPLIICDGIISGFFAGMIWPAYLFYNVLIAYKKHNKKNGSN